MVKNVIPATGDTSPPFIWISQILKGTHINPKYTITESPVLHHLLKSKDIFVNSSLSFPCVTCAVGVVLTGLDFRHCEFIFYYCEFHNI